VEELLKLFLRGSIRLGIRVRNRYLEIRGCEKPDIQAQKTGVRGCTSTPPLTDLKPALEADYFFLRQTESDSTKWRWSRAARNLRLNDAISETAVKDSSRTKVIDTEEFSGNNILAGARVKFYVLRSDAELNLLVCNATEIR
jgi:hypothetical protein